MVIKWIVGYFILHNNKNNKPWGLSDITMYVALASHIADTDSVLRTC